MTTQEIFLGFFTKTNVKTLCEARCFYIDGTFKTCPPHFTQLLTIHALYHGVYIPLVFFILPSKSVDSYTSAFQHLGNHCSQWGFQCLPTRIFVDFEVSIHTAALSVWGQAKIIGCRFHLGQSWYRKLSSLGLRQVYSSSSEKSNFLKLFFELPFLRPDSFTDDLMAILPAGNDKLMAFCDYILQTYVSPTATFPPHIWAQYSSSLNRTTNSCEFFHSKLNRLATNAYPNIFCLVKLLKDIQSK